jgi:FlgD Ig-like domain
MNSRSCDALRRSSRSVAAGAALWCVVACAVPAVAQPTLGFMQEWPGDTLHGWGGGSVTVNPGTGGRLGAGDGYLRVSTTFPVQLGTVCFCPEFAGNWQAAGITHVRLWLDDVDDDQALEMHFGIGTNGNFWQYNTGFIPPEHQWGQFDVDLSSASGFTRIIGSTGTFDAALQNVDRLLIRHDRPPFMMFPDSIQADVGIDGLLLTHTPLDVSPLEPVAGRPVELAPPFPNPARGPITFSFRSFDGGPVRLEVVDVSGRSVRRVELEAAPPGPRLWLWDGRDGTGHPVPAGSYRVRAVGEMGGTSRPLVRLR